MATRSARVGIARKLHREHKIAIGFVVLAAAAFFGYQAFAAFQVDGIKFAKIPPGKISIVGVNAGVGYRIIVSNQVAQLIETSGETFEEGYDYDSGENDTGGPKKRVPLREMLQTLRGDETALGKFVTAMNDDLRKMEMPTAEVVWSAPHVKKALDGDPALKRKLEQDLNVTLDGQPLDRISRTAVDQGIVLQCKVPVKVAVAGEVRTMEGEIKIPYTPRFITDLRKRFEKVFEVTPAILKGNYLEAARELEEQPRNREDVARVLRDIIDPVVLERRFADAPSRVLQNAFVVLNEEFIEGASFRERDGPEGKPIFDIDIALTDEGRRRLWQFSRRNPGTQLLFIVDGIAIAAPRIRHELTRSNIAITQVPDRGLVEDAVDQINSLRKPTK